MKYRLLLALAATSALAAPALAVTTTASLPTWQFVAGDHTRDTLYGTEFTNITSLTFDEGTTVNFGAAVNIRTIGSGWATWCCSYTDQVLYTNGATSLTGTFADAVTGFGFYSEPNPFAEYLVTLTLSDGSAIQTVIDGDGGASFMGWNGAGITGFTISSSVDFAIGDFYIDNVRAIPEPATWAMMIGGFGLVGASMRRRRKISVSYA